MLAAESTDPDWSALKLTKDSPDLLEYVGPAGRVSDLMLNTDFRNNDSPSVLLESI